MISLNVNRVIGEVNVPVWGIVPLRALTLAEMRRIEQSKDDMIQAFLMGIGFSVSYPDGKRVFSDEDIPKLADVPLEILQPISDMVGKLMGFTTENVNAAKKN